MKEFLAAPLSGLPFEPTAFSAHVSRLHFVRKLVRAALSACVLGFELATSTARPGGIGAASTSSYCALRQRPITATRQLGASSRGSRCARAERLTGSSQNSMAKTRTLSQMVVASEIAAR